MLEEPDVAHQAILRCLQEQFHLEAEEVSFLPLGADLNTAVYRACTREGQAYFVKLRSGDFNPASVAVPTHMHRLGIRQVIPCLETRAGQLHGFLDQYRVLVYPYIPGRDGYEQPLTPEQWAELGAALKELHSASFPAQVIRAIKTDELIPRWGARLRKHLDQVQNRPARDPSAVAMAALLEQKRIVILELIQSVEETAKRIQRDVPGFCLCHGDIHCWNLLVSTDGRLYLVDWDTLLLAPKERDLMFIGGGLSESGYPPGEEERLFFQGYGKVEVDQRLIAYYRMERILEDMSVYCDQILLSEQGGKDRPQAVLNVRANFEPGGTLERAYAALRKS